MIRKTALMMVVVLACSACDLFVMEERPFGSAWWVRNATDRTLQITPPPYGSTEGALTLGPGESVRLYSRSEYGEVPYFEMVMILWRGRTESETIDFVVRSEDGDELKRWTLQVYDIYTERNFFDHSSWTRTSDRERERKHLCEWTFEITETDITPHTEL